MEISVRIDCTPTEARRVCGAPDLLPIYQTLAVALEDWLVCVVDHLDPTIPATDPNDVKPGSVAPTAGRR